MCVVVRVVGSRTSKFHRHLSIPHVGPQMMIKELASVIRIEPQQSERQTLLYLPSELAVNTPAEPLFHTAPPSVQPLKMSVYVRLQLNLPPGSSRNGLRCQPRNTRAVRSQVPVRIGISDRNRLPGLVPPRPRPNAGPGWCQSVSSVAGVTCRIKRVAGRSTHQSVLRSRAATAAGRAPAACRKAVQPSARFSARRCR